MQLIRFAGELIFQAKLPDCRCNLIYNPGTRIVDEARVVGSKKTVSNAISKKYVESFSLYYIHE